MTKQLNNKWKEFLFAFSGFGPNFLMVLMGAYFTMISVGIGIGRGLICYRYEKLNKRVPMYMIIALCCATILSYIIINYIVLSGTASPWDILYMIASCMYAITFAIRNIKLMRCMVLIPHACAILYNLLVAAPISSVISYGIEFVITIVAIIKFHIQEKIKMAE